MSTIDTMLHLKQTKTAFGNRLTLLLTGLWTTVLLLSERRKSRLHLLELTDVQLKDIGLTRDDAFREAQRSFFDPIQFQSQSDWKRSL